MRGKTEDLLGKQFGKLTVLERVKKENTSGQFWICKCSCGNTTKPIVTNSLVKLKTISCGCYKIQQIKKANTTHKMTNSGTYISWRSMWARCTNIKRRDYDFYKDKVPDERWTQFENFLQDMGERPTNTSLDRIDNSKRYSKDNCRWASKIVQSRNKRNNINLTINGQVYCLKSASELFSVSYNSVKSRIRNGWDAYEAVSTPKTNRHERSKLKNKEGVFVKDE